MMTFPPMTPELSELLRAQNSAFGLGTGSLQSPSQQCPLQRRGALEVVVLDEANEPLPGCPIELSREGAAYPLTSTGVASLRFEGLDPVPMTLTLPGVDGSAWTCTRSDPLPPERAWSTTQAPWQPPVPARLVEGIAHALAGEGIDKLALRYGHLPETVWLHPRNEALRLHRMRRNTLKPGDPVFVPARVQSSLPVTAGNTYVLTRKGTVARLRLRFTQGFESFKKIPYYLEPWAGDQQLPAQAGELLDGVLDARVSVRTTEAVVTLWDAGRVRLSIDTLLPVLEDRGVRQRLRNLGIPCPLADGWPDDEAVAALRRLQQAVGLQPSGELDNQTRSALYTVHDRAP